MDEVLQRPPAGRMTETQHVQECPMPWSVTTSRTGMEAPIALSRKPGSPRGLPSEGDRDGSCSEAPNATTHRYLGSGYGSARCSGAQVGPCRRCLSGPHPGVAEVGRVQGAPDATANHYLSNAYGSAHCCVTLAEFLGCGHQGIHPQGSPGKACPGAPSATIYRNPRSEYGSTHCFTTRAGPCRCERTLRFPPGFPR